MKNDKEDLEKQLEKLDQKVKIGVIIIDETAKQAITTQVQFIKDIQRISAGIFSEIKNLDDSVRSSVLEKIKKAEKEPNEINWDDLLNG